MKTSNNKLTPKPRVTTKRKPAPTDCLVELKDSFLSLPRASKKEAINIIYNLLPLLTVGGFDLLRQALQDNDFTEIVIPLQPLHPTIEFTYKKWEGIITVTPLEEVKDYVSDELTLVSRKECSGVYLYHDLPRYFDGVDIDVRPYVKYFEVVTDFGRTALDKSFKAWRTEKDASTAEAPTVKTDDVMLADILATLALVVNKTLPLDVAMGALSKKYPEDGKRIATRLLHTLSSGQLDKEI